jgi:hypothetical protein
VVPISAGSFERGANQRLVVRRVQVIRLSRPGRVDDRRIVVDVQLHFGLAECADAIREDDEEQVDQECQRGHDGHESVRAETALRPVAALQAAGNDRLGFLRRVARLIRIAHGIS